MFGFEEALGYLVNPETVRDKDGISAAIAMLGMVADARGDGARRSPTCCTSSSETFGAFASDQISIRVDDLGDDRPDHGGAAAEHPSAHRRDRRVARRRPARRRRRACRPGDVLRLWLDDGSRVIVRPSGTEPKLKLYLDVRGDSAEDARARIGALGAGGPRAARPGLLTLAGAALGF